MSPISVRSTGVPPEISCPDFPLPPATRRRRATRRGRTVLTVVVLAPVAAAVWALTMVASVEPTRRGTSEWVDLGPTVLVFLLLWIQVQRTLRRRLS